MLQLISEGNESAYHKLYDRFWKKIYSVAIQYVKSSQTAQDIVQDVFIKVWIKREELPSIRNFNDWLFIIARNMIISDLRKKTPRYGLEISETTALKEDSLLPDQQLAFKETGKFISEAIAKLPPRQKQVYQLSRTEHLNYKEIAGMLDISSNTVREHVTQALKSIRNYLKEKLGDAYLFLMIVTHFIKK